MKTVENIEVFSPEHLALAEHLECDPNELSEYGYDYYGLTTYSHGNTEYAIGTDDEANKAMIESVKESVWAFNPSFLSEFTGLPEDMFKFASEQCESSNDAILQVIDQNGGIEDFANMAESYDGRGHFLSSYDGCENEQGEYFIYRTN